MEISEIGLSAIPAITVLCYLIGVALKASNIDNSWIPASMGICGAILGVIGMIVMQDFPATDYITAAAVGAVSGFASTGVNQIIVQSKKSGSTGGD